MQFSSLILSSGSYSCKGFLLFLSHRPAGTVCIGNAEDFIHRNPSHSSWYDLTLSPACMTNARDICMLPIHHISLKSFVSGSPGSPRLDVYVFPFDESICFRFLGWWILENIRYAQHRWPSLETKSREFERYSSVLVPVLFFSKSVSPCSKTTGNHEAKHCTHLQQLIPHV